MGWTSSSDMNGEVRISFETQEEAVAYAQKHGIAFELQPPKPSHVVIKAYADNFAYNRKQSWTLSSRPGQRVPGQVSCL